MRYYDGCHFDIQTKCVLFRIAFKLTSLDRSLIDHYQLLKYDDSPFQKRITNGA